VKIESTPSSREGSCVFRSGYLFPCQCHPVANTFVSVPFAPVFGWFCANSSPTRVSSCFTRPFPSRVGQQFMVVFFVVYRQLCCLAAACGSLEPGVGPSNFAISLWLQPLNLILSFSRFLYRQRSSKLQTPSVCDAAAPSSLFDDSPFFFLRRTFDTLPSASLAGVVFFHRQGCSAFFLRSGRQSLRFATRLGFRARPTTLAPIP